MSRKKRGTFLYGTSSWSEKSWRGVFYPEEMPPGDHLTYYAGHAPATITDLAERVAAKAL